MSTYNHFGCSRCGGPFNGGNCPSCSIVGAENEFVYDLNPFPYNNTPDFYNHPPQPRYESYLCELCGNDAHYGYDCPPRFPLVYEQEPSYNQNFSDNYYPQNSLSFPQQYLCCENYGGPHESFQCQPINQNCFDPNSLGFDQIQPPQFYVMHQLLEEIVKEFEKKPKTIVISALEGVIQPPQETSVEILQARENLMKSIQTFLNKFNRISFRETPKVLSQAWEKFFEIQHAFREKQHQPEKIQELLHQLLKDLQIISEELAEYINSLSWNCHAFYNDDDEYTIQYREYLENSSNAITLVLPIEEPDNSLSIGDDHLSTIPETESDEVTKSSVEDLIFSDFNNDCTSNDDDSFEDIDYVETSPPDSELVSLEEVKDDILHDKLLNINLLISCDLPSSDDFYPISIFEEKSVTFSNPLLNSNDDFTFSDNESLSDEDVPKDVKIYSNPLFEFDDEYISSDVNSFFDEVLEDIECKDFYDPNLDESTFLVTPLFDSNEDECLALSDDIELLLHHDPSISIVSILEGFTNKPPLEENDDLFDLESKEND
ncbi:hypothetical protein Tco_0459920 [Tanacetum coccineum]